MRLIGLHRTQGKGGVPPSSDVGSGLSASAPGGTRHWFALLLGVASLSQCVVFAGRPMTSYRALDLGAGTFGVGWVTACFAVLPLLLAIPAGRGVDGKRAISYLRAGSGCSLAGALALAAANSLITLALANAIAGVGLLFTAIAGQGIIARRTPLARHDHAFGLFTVAVSGGQLVGPLVAGMVAHRFSSGNGSDSARAGLLVAAGFALGLIVLSFCYREAPRGEEPAPSRPGDSEVPASRVRVGSIMGIRGMGPAILASLSLLSCVDLITAFLPVLAEHNGLSTQMVGWLLALRALASLASRLLVARLAGRWGRKAVLTASMALSGVALVWLPFSGGVIGLVVVMLVAGFTLGIGQPLTMSWVTGLVPAPTRATALAIRLSANRVGQVAVPAAAGLVAGVAGPGSVFFLSAALLSSATAGVMISRPTRTDDE